MLAGAALVAATYGYFLLFAQFAFLTLTKAAAPSALSAILAAQGLAGIAGSVLAALWFRPGRTKALLAGGFLACALAAAAAAFATATIALIFIAALTGLALGVTTVTLASALRAITGLARLGLACGLGTGSAYALCTVPTVFAAAPITQSWLAVSCALGGATIVCLADFKSPSFQSVCHLIGDKLPAAGDRPSTWVVMLFTLVAFDSAAFNIIQHAPDLKAAAWSDPGWLYAAAAGQMLAGVAAGTMLDRDRCGAVVAFALFLLAGAVLLIAQPAGWLCVPYAAGVALYSTALVHYPARAASPRLAALVYAVCGWGGSALGLGLAQGRTAVPAWWVAAVAGTAVLARMVRRPFSSIRWSSDK